MHNSPPAESNPIEAVIFDLGGVLLDFDFDRANKAAARVSGLSSDEVKRRLFSWPEFVAFERGEIEPHAFHQGLEKLLGTTMPYAVFCEAWNGIFKDEIEPTVSLLREIKGRMKVGVLSNTNVIHFEHIRVRMRLLSELEHVYASHEIGARKPEPECYKLVLRKMNVAPQRAVFVDDVLENIEAARALGMRVIHARNAAVVRAGLQELNLVNACPPSPRV